MTCSEFLARFSEYYDGAVSASDRKVFDAHIDGCPSCRRYLEVVRRGVQLLREIPSLKPRQDFLDRLRHAMYSIDEERRRRRTSSGASGGMAVVAVAAVLAMLVWTPIVRPPEPTVELAPIVASRPAPLPFIPLVAPRPIETPAPAALFAKTDLWSRSNVLLYLHSDLGRRYRDTDLIRIGLR